MIGVAGLVGYTGERAVISGGVALDGAWARHDAKIWASKSHVDLVVRPTVMFSRVKYIGLGRAPQGVYRWNRFE